MKIDPLGIPIYNKKEVLDLLYQENYNLLEQIFVDIDQKEIDQFNDICEEIKIPKLTAYTSLNIEQQFFDSSLQNSWLMPDEYKDMDIEGYLVHVCPKENYQRLIEELQEFRSRNMMNLLRWLKYFVDTCRKENIVWGVGRGSSVASYALFLIGVHKIDSIKYNLNWREFLR